MTPEQLEEAIARIDRGVKAVVVDTPLGTYYVDRPVVVMDGALGALVEGELSIPGARNPHLGVGPVRLETALAIEVIP